MADLSIFHGHQVDTDSESTKLVRHDISDYYELKVNRLRQGRRVVVLIDVDVGFEGRSLWVGVRTPCIHSMEQGGQPEITNVLQRVFFHEEVPAVAGFFDDVHRDVVSVKIESVRQVIGCPAYLMVQNELFRPKIHSAAEQPNGTADFRATKCQVHRATRLDNGYICSNGPCWSPDGGTLYVSDSNADAIFLPNQVIDQSAIGRFSAKCSIAWACACFISLPPCAKSRAARSNLRDGQAF